MPSATTRNMKVEFVGLNKLVRDLRALDVELVAEVKTLNLEAAKIVAALAQKEAPVGTGAEGDRHPGLLKKTIRAGATARGGFVKAGGGKVVYAGAIHFGWEARNIAADQFLYRGLELGRAEVMHVFSNGIAAVVDRAIAFEGGV